MLAAIDLIRKLLEPDPVARCDFFAGHGMDMKGVLKHPFLMGDKVSDAISPGAGVVAATPPWQHDARIVRRLSPSMLEELVSACNPNPSMLQELMSACV